MSKKVVGKLKKSMVKIWGISLFLLALMIFPNTIALADNVEGNWTTLASMSTPRDNFQTEVINGKIYVMGGGSFAGIKSTEVYDPTTNEWTNLANMPVERSFFQTEVMDGKIYVMGGIDNRVTNVYDPNANKWTTIADMNAARKEFQTEVINGKIYAIGGDNVSGGVLKSTEVYDPSTNKWTKLADMPSIRSNFQTEVINGKIYVMGGIGEKTTEVYDPPTDKWTKLADMPSKKFAFQTEVINGKIYVIGGRDGNESIDKTEVYDPTTNEWTTLASMSTPRHFAKTEVVNGKIYAIGGYAIGGVNSVGDLNTAEVYDPTTNKWTKIASMSTTRGDFQTEEINGKIYAIGGSQVVRLSSMEVYRAATSSSKQLKVVLEINEKLQLSVDDHLDENTNMTWTSSDSTVAQVNENGVVTAIKAGNAVIHVKSQDGSYSDEINILVVDNANDYRLAVDLNVGKTSRLTVDDLTNTINVTWDSSDSAVATVSSKGVVTAKGKGLALAMAKDNDGNVVGQVYIRVRES